ncbi:DegV family protein [Nocardioides sp. CFH 31398]|uniref:DegV family protein n=1 Tax=Nocardioides sp. CFH 31398 TaxID=2919579 RepID=UPI001F0511BF|nr:DegV family protein [Nocardioides sp. CFH 31398]MCH1868411.1 DegV family protein [Nocardioides sp. CFH 31398]
MPGQPGAEGGRVVVVTDSTASLPRALVRERGLVVVPLQVVIGDEVLDEALSEEEGAAGGATPARVAEALRGHQRVSTSRPNPAAMGAVYADLVADGATEVVAVHLSGEVSGTVESARVAAREAAVPVHVVDTRQVGVATGYAALSAVETLEAGGSAEEAADAAARRAAAATSYFYVDTLEFLRRGGRIGAGAALLGSALAVKPLLSITDGVVGPLERVRTTTKALARLEELAVRDALTAVGRSGSPVEVGVAHLANPERAEQLAAHLAARLGDDPGLVGQQVRCVELGAVLGAHVGPGMVAVCVSPL